METSKIGNKQKRSLVAHKLKVEKAKEKRARRLKLKKDEAEHPELKEQRLAANVPRTIENTREYDPDFQPVGDNEEVLQQIEHDEFASYFTDGVAPKILVTTTKQPSAELYEFCKEFCDIFPSAQFVKRGKQFLVKHLVEIAKKRDFTDLIIIGEHRKVPNTVTVIHLPEGPTAQFRLSSIVPSKQIHGHGRATAHLPELILNNFSTRLGHTVGRMFAALMPHQPEFQGRQVATFHNQRDFIFFRRHRYIFKDGKRADLQELGPRFTLKLMSLQKGTFELATGEKVFEYKPAMEKNRRRFFL
ncbi:anticodon-binding protein [Hyaloraphidium curvatum]|nr:anticodon-binding protein [Hyaloraphidium curvatum]